MKESFKRTAMLFGTEAEEILNAKTVAVYGAGGVGGHCIEALARSGIGHIHITDPDAVSVSNLNRQCAATKEFIGTPKTEAMKQRVLSVSDAVVSTNRLFVLPENIEEAVPKGVDYIIDAIDTVSAKLALVKYANLLGIPIISCMGMGNRCDPSKIRIGDLFSVTGCPLARVMRRELRKANISNLKVVYSVEPPKKPLPLEQSDNPRKQIPGSCAFVPAAAGLFMASAVILDILKISEQKSN